MQTLTFNNKQLLFVPVPMDSYNYTASGRTLHFKRPHSKYKEVFDKDFASKIAILGTIQKENGKVSTTIDYELMLLMTELIGYECTEIEAFVDMMESQSLAIQDGEQYVVLEVKS